MTTNRTPGPSTSSGDCPRTFSLWFIIICAAAILLILPLAAVGQEAGSEGSTYGAIVATVQEMNRLLDASIELALSGIGGRLTDDRTVIAHRLLNLLEGPNSSLFDPSVDTAEPIGLGLRHLWEEYDALFYGIDDGTEREALLDSVPLAAIVAMNDLMLFDMGDFLRLASEAAQEAIAIEGVTDEAWYARNDAFRSVYAHLNAMRGSNGDPHLATGFLTVADLLPPIEIWIGPDESIQAAIDRLPNGGTVHLGPGVYEETLTIDKPITLVGSGSKETTIQGVDWRVTVMIMADSATGVTIRGMALLGGSDGVLVSGEAQVIFDDVRIEGLRTGLGVTQEASVVCSNTRLSGGLFSVWCNGSTRCELRDGCLVTGTQAGPLSAVVGEGRASLAISDSKIEGNQGSGIHLKEEAELHLVNCTIQNNGGYGIGTCFLFSRTPILGDEDIKDTHAGSITGGGNIIPDEDEENANLRGAFCPDSLDFLTEPLPED